MADLLDSNRLNWLVIESAAGLLGIFCQDPIARRLHLHGSPQASLDGLNHVEKLDWLLVSYIAQTHGSLCPPPLRRAATRRKSQNTNNSLHDILDESEVPPQVTKVIQLDRAPGQDRINLMS